MSIALKCDRCGVFYERSDLGEIKNSPYGVWKGNNSADLCPTCCDELYRWFTNPKESRPVGYWMGRVAGAAREAWEAMKDTPEYKAAVEAAAERMRTEEGGEQEWTTDETS